MTMTKASKINSGTIVRQMLTTIPIGGPVEVADRVTVELCHSGDLL
jgi:hypothetical protein